MALLFVDSTDHYDTGDRLLKWTANRSNACTITTNNPRFTGSQSINIANQTGGQGIYKAIPGGALTTLVVGFAWYPSSIFSSAQSFCFLTDSGTTQVGIQMNSAGQLVVSTPGGDYTGSTVISAATWCYIELKATIDNSVGAVELRLNGATEVSQTNIDTQSTANASVNRLEFQTGTSTPPAFQVRDVYILDTTGGAPTNDFLGDIRIEALMPNGNGNSSQWVGSDADSTDNYLHVDEVPADDDTSYVQTSTSGNKDTYAYGDLVSTTGTVYAVAPISKHRKTTAGSRSIISVARLSATETDSANKVVFDTYSYQQDIRTAKPGGGAWTISDVNSAEFGYKVS